MKKNQSLAKWQQKELSLALKKSEEGFVVIADPSKLQGGYAIDINIGKQCSCIVNNNVVGCGCSAP